MWLSVLLAAADNIRMITEIVLFINLKLRSLTFADFFTMQEESSRTKDPRKESKH